MTAKSPPVRGFWQFDAAVPVFCCCPSQLQWCFRWRPQPHQWEHWTARCLPHESRIWTRTLHLHCTPGTESQWKYSVNNVAAHFDPNNAENGWTVYPYEGIQHTLTFTEWLWKSVTIISFLLFTATKCGPGRGQRGRLLRKRKHVPVVCTAPFTVSRPFKHRLQQVVPKAAFTKPCSNQTVSSSVFFAILFMQ